MPLQIRRGATTMVACRIEDRTNLHASGPHPGATRHQKPRRSALMPHVVCRDGTELD
jgi:hypothetical protein